MIQRRSFNQLDSEDHGRRGDHWDAERMGGVMMTCLAIALRGLLVTTIVVATIAYLLLVNSHV
jgi:hypothetical protein